MDYRVMAVSELRAYRTCAAALASIDAQIKEINEDIMLAEGFAGISGTLGKRMNDVLGELQTSLTLARLNRSSVMRRVKRVDAALESLPEREKKLLKSFFIEKAVAEDICADASLEKSAVYKSRAAAIESFTRAMFGTVLS